MKFNLKLLLIVLLGRSYLSIGLEFCYPVVNADANSFLLVYQKSLGDLELWRYFPDSNRLEKCLDWRFVPLGLKILPDQSGFSFIDAGRLRIKRFMMRSPKTIDFNLPIYGVSELNWLDSSSCYLSAKQHGHSNYFTIFKGDANSSELTSWRQESESDCLCPVVLGEQLFYVERQGLDRATQIKLLELDQPQSTPVTILNCNFQQIVSLQICNSNLGYYVEHMPYLKDQINLVSFICHIFSKSKQWREVGQFKFQVPTKYLLGAERAQESIGIFLPRIEKTALYFADFKQNSDESISSSINCYDLTTGKISAVLSSSPDSPIFGPLIHHDQLYYGKILTNSALDLENLILNGIGRIKL